MGIVYDALRPPFAVFGVPFYDANGRLERLPRALREELPQLKDFGRRVPGGRIGFRTDAARFTVRVAVEGLTVDAGMSLYACQSVAVMRGERTRATFMGLVAPHSYTECTFERTFEKSAAMEEITLWLPRNETVTAVSVELPEGASLEPPTPYRFGKVLFYGSSITEGGCSSLPVTNYIALLSRWLDLDFYCMGFSGRAKGERAMAEYLKTLDVSIFVYDYDHNAPTVEHLSATHEPFFKILREAHPTLPVVFLTRPNFDETPDAAARRAVVRATYEAARACGDEHVYFVDGERMFGAEDRTLCTMDGTHPNDLGFRRMAEAIRPTLAHILGIG